VALPSRLLLSCAKGSTSWKKEAYRAPPREGQHRKRDEEQREAWRVRPYGRTPKFYYLFVLLLLGESVCVHLEGTTGPPPVPAQEGAAACFVRARPAPVPVRVRGC
jgi:hypothetical protein